MGTRAGELPLIYYEILGADRLARKLALENLARTSGVACLCRQRAARDMWRHAVVRHGAPRMILRRRLREPDVARIARKLSASALALPSSPIREFRLSRNRQLATILQQHEAGQSLI